jgi:hypothetical protein
VKITLHSFIPHFSLLISHFTSPATGSVVRDKKARVAIIYSVLTVFLLAACESLNDSSAHTLTGITVATNPTKTSYAVGETFSSAGLVVSAAYDDGSAESVTGWTLKWNDAALADGTTAITAITAEAGEKTVTVSYEDKTAVFTIKVGGGPGSGAYAISLSVDDTHDFGTADEGYSVDDLALLTVTVTNTGNQPTGALTVTLTGTNAGSFTRSPGSLAGIAAGGAGTFTVRPNTGLAVGTYGATVSVSGGNDISADFTVSFTVKPFFLTNVTDAADYLSKATGGDTANDPVSLPVNLRLTAKNWQDLLQAIREVEKFVDLDISSSALTSESTEFNPGEYDTGERYIVGLVLPGNAESTVAGSYGKVIFRYFTSLTSVSGPAISFIGAYAFFECSSLITVDFPAAETIGQSAFDECSSLTTVYFPAAETINAYAFSKCSSLTTVDFPAVTSIDVRAFSECSSLTTASFPAATSIGRYAFSKCSSLTTASFPAVTSIDVDVFAETGPTALTIDLPQAAPMVATGLGYSSGGYAKSVTIKTPADKTGYNDDWEYRFKREAFPGDDVTLTFTTYTP